SAQEAYIVYRGQTRLSYPSCRKRAVTCFPGTMAIPSFRDGSLVVLSSMNVMFFVSFDISMLCHSVLLSMM
mgnify:CR=1